MRGAGLALRLGGASAIFAIAALAVAQPAQRAGQAAPAGTPVPGAQPPEVPADVVLQQRLDEARQEILRLRAQVVGQANAEKRLAACAEKNERLIGIGNDLIAAYGARYRRGRYMPFDLTRHRFEAELQATGDRVYDNRLDAGPPRRPTPAATPTETSEETSR